MSQTLDTASLQREPGVAPSTRTAFVRFLGRPETGALAGAIAVYLFFYAFAPAFRDASSFASVLYVSSTFGIPAVAVAPLMIGGEFDLSAGVAVIAAALAASMFSYQLNTNMWVGVLVSFGIAMAIGFINGYLVVTTGIPSFLVTLGTFFMIQGLNLAVTKLITGNVATSDVSNMQGFHSAHEVFASTITVGGVALKVTLFWWIGFVLVGTWILRRTRVGNWIFAVGGSATSARAVGVPVKQVKVGLFMAVSFLTWFTGMHLLFNYNTIQSGNGIGNEFVYIISAVVGGCLLTGGYGSVVGAAIGALIFGMTNQGIVYAGWNPDWFKFFLGAILLAAILLNNWIRGRGEEANQ